MNRNVLSLRVLAGAAVAALALAGCGGGGDNNGPGGETKLSGSVTIDGSSTVAPLSKAAAELYSDTQPDVRVAVGTSGTGGGFKKFCVGETDISDASRPIKDAEKAECEKNNVKFTELQVANDALTVVVHKEASWVDCLTKEQLKKIWEPGSTVNNWNQVDASYPNEPLKLFAPGTDSGTFDYFTEVINGEAQASRSDATFSEDDNVLVDGVAGSKGGIGYFGFSYFEEAKDKVKALKIDGGKGCVEPSLAGVQDGSYAPLGRPLFIYVSGTGAAKPQVVDFVKYYLEDIDNIVKEAKFVPLTADQKAKAKTNLDTLLAAK